VRSSPGMGTLWPGSKKKANGRSNNNKKQHKTHTLYVNSWYTARIQAFSQRMHSLLYLQFFAKIFPQLI
jgi:hypothetical protein